MTNATAFSSPVIPERWWELPEYQEPELYLPGQSQLDEADRAMLENIAGRADAGDLHIPPMAQAAIAAVNLLRSEEADIKDISKSIELDPMLTVQVLRHANSALYGPATVIDTVHHALSFLGLRRTQVLIMEAVLKQATGAIGSKLYAGMEWHYSLHCASIARRLGQLTRNDPDLCYTCGLLHDIGRIPILQALSDFQALPQSPGPGDSHEIILEVLHRGVGIQMAKAWKLPPAVCDAISAHLNGRLSDEKSESGFPSTRVVEAASDICLALGLGRVKRPHAVLEGQSFTALGLSQDTITRFGEEDLPEIARHVEEIS